MQGIEKLKGDNGRAIHRHLEGITGGSQKGRFTAKRTLVSQHLQLPPKGVYELYSIHPLGADCISEGNVGLRYEFGCRVNIATTLDKGFVVGIRCIHDSPNVGQTLKETLEQGATQTDRCTDLAVVSHGYHGNGEEKTRVLISGTRHSLAQKAIADRRRRAIEAEISKEKSGNRLLRCPMKDTIGDAMFAILCVCGHNVCNILAHLSACPVWVIAVTTASQDHRQQGLMAA